MCGCVEIDAVGHSPVPARDFCARVHLGERRTQRCCHLPFLPGLSAGALVLRYHGPRIRGWLELDPAFVLVPPRHLQIELKQGQTTAGFKCTDGSAVVCARHWSASQSGSAGDCFFFLGAGRSLQCSGDAGYVVLMSTRSSCDPQRAIVVASVGVLMSTRNPHTTRPCRCQDQCNWRAQKRA